MTESRVYVPTEIMEAIKEKFPEAKHMTYSGLVKWALSYLLKIQKAEYIEKGAS